MTEEVKSPPKSKEKSPITHYKRVDSELATELPASTVEDDIYSPPRRLYREDVSTHEVRTSAEEAFRLPASGGRGGHEGPKLLPPKPVDLWTMFARRVVLHTASLNKDARRIHAGINAATSPKSLKNLLREIRRAICSIIQRPKAIVTTRSYCRLGKIPTLRFNNFPFQTL